MRDIGKNIRDLRERSNLTQEELAGKLYVTRQTISNYENGRSRPDIDMILKIAEILEVDANTLLYGIPVPEDRKKAHRRMACSSALLLVMTAAGFPLHALCENISTRQYVIGPKLLMNMVYDPAGMFLLGWCIMQGIYLIWRPKPIKKAWFTKVRKGLLIGLLACAVVVIPFAVYCCAETYVGLTADNVSMGFPYIPIYWEILSFIIKINVEYDVVYVILGMALIPLSSHSADQPR